MGYGSSNPPGQPGSHSTKDCWTVNREVPAMRPFVNCLSVSILQVAQLGSEIVDSLCLHLKYSRFLETRARTGRDQHCMVWRSLARLLSGSGSRCSISRLANVLPRQGGRCTIRVAARFRLWRSYVAVRRYAIGWRKEQAPNQERDP